MLDHPAFPCPGRISRKAPIGITRVTVPRNCSPSLIRRVSPSRIRWALGGGAVVAGDRDDAAILEVDLGCWCAREPLIVAPNRGRLQSCRSARDRCGS